MENCRKDDRMRPGVGRDGDATCALNQVMLEMIQTFIGLIALLDSAILTIVR